MSSEAGNYSVETPPTQKDAEDKTEPRKPEGSAEDSSFKKAAQKALTSVAISQAKATKAETKKIWALEEQAEATTRAAVALEDIAKTLNQLMQAVTEGFMLVGASMRDTVPSASDADKEKRELAGHLALAELELSTRTRNCLNREGLQFLQELTLRGARDLLDIRSFGKRSLYEIREKLAQYGLSLLGEE